MAGDIDVYQNCPCGSGKKLKFCCHAIVGDMVKIADMQKHHQYQMALAALDGLEKKNLKEVWSRAWVKTTKALILSTLKQADEARRLVEDVLDELPEHPLAAAMNGMLALGADGYPAAKRAIYEAFEAAAEHRVFLASHLATTLGAILAMHGHMLAAREHFALGVTLDNESEEAIRGFLSFEQQPSVAYPLRSHYRLSPFAGDDRWRVDYAAAATLAGQGCFSDAAKAFGKIARQEPNLPGIWRNMALCHAWAAEEPLAAQAFKAAAANQPDVEAAADMLLLSRLLLAPSGAEAVERVGQEYRVSSVGKLLTLLDQHPLYARGEEEEEEEEKTDSSAAWYQVLDRAPQPAAGREVGLDDVPRIVGQITVLNADAEKSLPARVIVGGLGREQLDRLKQQFAEVAGAEIEATGEPVVAGVVRGETAALLLPLHFPEDIAPAKAEALQRARWERIIGEVWPGVPQAALGGKTPFEAAAVPELKAALLAAVLALDVFCEQSGFTLDQSAVRSRLGLPPSPDPLDIAPDDNPSQFSILELRRVPLDRLTDDQLVAVTNRINRLGHSGMGYEAVHAVLARPELAEKTEKPKLYLTLCNLSRRRLCSDEALVWLDKALQEGKARKLPLETLLMWQIEELVMRSADRNDPRLPELAATLWNYYRPKIAGSAEVIAGVLNELGLPGPWNAQGPLSAVAEPLAAAGVGASALWTPEAQTAGQPSKLWLPGQE